MESKKLTGYVLEHPLTSCGLTVEPGEGGQAVARGDGRMDRQRFERQFNILRGYACLSLGRLPMESERVDLASLELPEDEGPNALAAVWFCRACEADTPAKVATAVYHGLGALPGGYEQVLARAERYMGPEQARHFWEVVAAAKRDEGDLAEKSPELIPAAFWERADVELMRAALLRACQE